MKTHSSRTILMRVRAQPSQQPQTIDTGRPGTFGADGWGAKASAILLQVGLTALAEGGGVECS